MKSVDDIFKEFGGPTAVAGALDIGVSTASEMRRRASIPGRYWHALEKAARSRGKTKVTLETIARIHAQNRVAS